MPSKIIKLSTIPHKSGVYQFFDQNDEILYVGKAKDLKKRLQSYTKVNGLSPRIEKMVFLAHKLEIIQTQSELEALLLEHNLIKKLAPKYNILLKDDKTFPHILITNHRFPRIVKHRGVKKDDGQYFGPFAAAGDVNRTIDILKKSFLLRGCTDSEFKSRTKPCLEYQIKRCSAPCANMINEGEYESLVNHSLGFLSGKSAKVQEDLAQKMLELSENFEYEKAAIIRDRIKSLTSIQSKQNINLEDINNADIVTLVQKNNHICVYISFFRGGNNYGSKPYFYEKNELDLEEFLIGFLGQFYLSHTPPELILLNLEISQHELIEDFLSNLNNKKTAIKTPKQGNKFKIIKDQEQIAEQNLEQKLVQNLSNTKILIDVKNLFDLNEVPKRIEVYDNSHISGQHNVGVFITAGKEGFIKSGYRKFNIRFDQTDKRDDTAMLEEVLRRRFKDVDQNSPNWPDLMIIDGGLGQLNAAKKVFEQLNISPRCVCMSKGPNRNAGEEFFHQIDKTSFTLPKNHQVMYYLQQLRDEAHRFAITTHRAKRAKTITKSKLDQIEGVGKVRKRALLNHFGSLDKIKSASIDDLKRVDGVSKDVAVKIKDGLN